MKGVFISYRRDDTADAASRLHDDLRRTFGQKQIFTDIYTITPGKDFAEEINTRVRSSDVVLVLIGKRWLTSEDAEGNRRLDDPNDYVRQEIKAALERNIPVIPVLLNGAKMPHQEDLPDEIKDLAQHQAYEISTVRWEYDVKKLTNELEGMTGAERQKYVAGALSVGGAVVAFFIANTLAAHIVAPQTFTPFFTLLILFVIPIAAAVGTYKVSRKALRNI